MDDRIFRGILAACSISLLAGCGGTQHVGQITPPVVQRLSGAWAFDARDSRDPADAMAQRRGETRAGREGGEGRGGDDGWGGRDGGRRPGGGFGGMRPGGGMGRGGMMPGGGMGGRPRNARANPEAMKAMRKLVMTTPTKLDIQLADSAVTVAYAGDPTPYVLPFGKKVERKLGDDLKLEARAEWQEDRLVVTRSVKGAGSISETFMPSVDGKRLTIDVEMDGGRGGGVDFQRVYLRPGEKASP